MRVYRRQVVQIDIDFDVYKALTLLRKNEEDSYSHVLRRLLQNAVPALPQSQSEIDRVTQFNENLTQKIQRANEGLTGVDRNSYIDTHLKGGAWFNNVLFPEGTELKGTYKGTTYYARIKGSQWVGNDGIVRKSPSDAASSISHTNVNGWRFWHARRPGDTEWKRLDKLR